MEYIRGKVQSDFLPHFLPHLVYEGSWKGITYLHGGHSESLAPRTATNADVTEWQHGYSSTLLLYYCEVPGDGPKWLSSQEGSSPLQNA